MRHPIETGPKHQAGYGEICNAGAQLHETMVVSKAESACLSPSGKSHPAEATETVWELLPLSAWLRAVSAVLHDIHRHIFRLQHVNRSAVC